MSDDLLGRMREVTETMRQFAMMSPGPAAHRLQELADKLETLGHRLESIRRDDVAGQAIH